MRMEDAMNDKWFRTQTEAKEYAEKCRAEGKIVYGPYPDEHDGKLEFMVSVGDAD